MLHCLAFVLFFYNGCSWRSKYSRQMYKCKHGHTPTYARLFCGEMNYHRLRKRNIVWFSEDMLRGSELTAK